MRLLAGAICCVVLAALGAACGSGTFTVADAAVDPTHTCVPGSAATAYEIRATVGAVNTTSQNVQVRSATASMIVAGVHGLWRQKLGMSYDAGHVPITPTTVAAASRTTFKMIVSSTCTNPAHAGVNDNYGEYSVQFTIVTSAGTFKLTSQNRHRIVAP
jgi:hypothetical protein